MYAQATCKADIYRGFTLDEGGEKVPNNGPTGRVAHDVIASVVERDSRVWDHVTQTPRVVRIVEGRIGSNVDVAIEDRIKDTTHGEWFVVGNVTRKHLPGRVPDTVLALKRVT